MFLKKSSSCEETEKIAQTLAGRLEGHEVLAFFGGMGMGKTAFVRGLARGLSITDDIASPTFALVHEYRGRHPLYHFDMYRVTNWEGLYSTGFFDYLETGVMAIEWSENIEEALPENAIKIHFSRGSAENDRVLKFEGNEPL